MAEAPVTRSRSNTGSTNHGTTEKVDVVVGVAVSCESMAAHRTSDSPETFTPTSKPHDINRGREAIQKYMEDNYQTLGDVRFKMYYRYSTAQYHVYANDDLTVRACYVPVEMWPKDRIPGTLLASYKALY